MTRATRASPSTPRALLGFFRFRFKTAGEIGWWPPWPGFCTTTWLLSQPKSLPHVHDSLFLQFYNIRFLEPLPSFLHPNLGNISYPTNQISKSETLSLAIFPRLKISFMSYRFQTESDNGSMAAHNHFYSELEGLSCNDQDVDFVLENRLWFVKGRIFHIRHWSPSFNPREDTIETLVLWVRLPNLPLHYWNKEAIIPIVQVIGRFIRLDERTENSENYVFARVCMELDLRTPLKRVLVIREEEEGDLPFDLVSPPAKVLISYEAIFEICFECGSHKHKIQSCPHKKKEKHFVMVDKEEGEGDIEPEGMEVDSEILKLASDKVILYFPQPAKTDADMEANPINNDNMNPPSPGWTHVRRKGHTTTKAAAIENSGNEKVKEMERVYARKGKAVLESKRALVKPGISFRDAAKGKGTIVINDKDTTSFFNQQVNKNTGKSTKSSSSSEEVVSSSDTISSVLSYSSYPDIAKLYNTPTNIRQMAKEPYSPTDAVAYFKANFNPPNVQFENFNDARASGFEEGDDSMNEFEVQMINGRRALVVKTDSPGMSSGSRKSTRDMKDDHNMAVADAENEEESASSLKIQKP